MPHSILVPQHCRLAPRRKRAEAGDLEPDVVVVLDLPDQLAGDRVGGDPDRMERAGRDFHAAVRAAYRTLAAERGWLLVDAHGTRDEVADRVWAAVEPVL